MVSRRRFAWNGNMDGCRLDFWGWYVEVEQERSLSLWLLYATYTFQRLAIYVPYL